MSSEIAVRARGLSKSYAIFERPQDRLKQMFVRGRRRFYRDFWAIRDIDLEIYRGETVGIVGRNGSGKSTLLQLICSTLTPTSGELDVNGRVAALLELGSGFDPEFTGRENAYLNGAILGLTANEIEERFDSIAVFADIGNFLDQPVKTYSSGMYARLAFAVAINVDPEILVVDEILSVGDEAFQRKCFARINNIKDSGGTVLFVSHAAGTVVELCDRAILMDGGKLMLTGLPKIVVSLYQKLLYAPSEKVLEIHREIREADQANTESTNSELSGASDSLEDHSVDESTVDEGHFDEGLQPESTVEYESVGASIRNVHVQKTDGQRVNVLVPGREYRYCYMVDFYRTCRKVRFGMLLRSLSGIDIGGQASHAENDGLDVVEAGQSIDVEFIFQNVFLGGVYFGNAGVLGMVDAHGHEVFLHRIIDATMFRVVSAQRGTSTAIVDIAVGTPPILTIRQRGPNEVLAS